MFRGLKVKKKHQKLTVLTKKFNYAKNVSGIWFVEKFAASNYKNIGKKFKENWKFER